MRQDFIGVVPAAGRAVRLNPFAYPKELIPIIFEFDSSGAQARPLLAIEYTLRAIRLAEVKRVLVVVSSAKTELVRILGDGFDYGVHLAYVNQQEPNGLARAVDTAYPWFAQQHVLLILPDTIYQPINAPSVLCRELSTRRADVLLGVFPTSRPEQLGPVRMESGGRVLEVQDKPERTDIRNTWGMAAWSPTFSSFAHERLTRAPAKQDIPLGSLFDAALREGLKVEALFFEKGRYSDAGTPEGIASILANHNRPSDYGL